MDEEQGASPAPPASPASSSSSSSSSASVNIALDSDGRLEGPGKDGLDFSFRSFDGVVGAADCERLVGECESVFAGESFWLGCDHTPATTLERIARGIFEFHTRHCEGFDRASSGAEWWVQVRGPGRADASTPTIAFHWDKDEDLVDDFGLNVHPHIASVTYLTSWGAPTVILGLRAAADHTRAPRGVVRDGWVSYPALGKHVCFDGRFLHAAPAELCLPPPPGDESPLRLTLLVNVWLNYKPSNIARLPAAAKAHFNLTNRQPKLNFSHPTPITDLSATPASTSPFEFALGNGDQRVCLRFPSVFSPPFPSPPPTPPSSLHVAFSATCRVRVAEAPAVKLHRMGHTLLADTPQDQVWQVVSSHPHNRGEGVPLDEVSGLLSDEFGLSAAKAAVVLRSGMRQLQGQGVLTVKEGRVRVRRRQTGK